MQGAPPGTYTGFAALTPSDTVPITCRAIYVGGAGNVTVKSGTPGAAAVTFTAPSVGTTLLVQLNSGYVMATGTTATLLVGLQ